LVHMRSRVRCTQMHLFALVWCMIWCTFNPWQPAAAAMELEKAQALVQNEAAAARRINLMVSIQQPVGG
jgi:hypothetical protein